MRAWKLSQFGWKQRLIAGALGVTEGAAAIRSRKHATRVRLLCSLDIIPAPLSSSNRVRCASSPTSWGTVPKPMASVPKFGFAPASPRSSMRSSAAPTTRDMSLSAPQRVGLDTADADRSCDPTRRTGDRALAIRGLASIQGGSTLRAPHPCFHGRTGLPPPSG